MHLICEVSLIKWLFCEVSVLMCVFFFWLKGNIICFCSVFFFFFSFVMHSCMCILYSFDDKYVVIWICSQHVQVPVPTPKSNEVCLKLEATSLNPVDWKIQKGMIRPFLPRKFPCIPATDVAGEVVEVGSGVKNFKAGDKVVAVLSHLVSFFRQTSRNFNYLETC